MLRSNVYLGLTRCKLSYAWKGFVGIKRILRFLDLLAGYKAKDEKDVKLFWSF